MLPQIPKGRRNKILHLSLFPAADICGERGTRRWAGEELDGRQPTRPCLLSASPLPLAEVGGRRRRAGEEDGAKPTRRAWAPRSVQMVSSFEGAIIGLALVSCCLPTALKSKTHSWRSE